MIRQDCRKNIYNKQNMKKRGMMMGAHSQEKKKTGKVFLRILLIWLIVMVVLAGILAGVAAIYVGNKLGKIEVEQVNEDEIGIAEETKKDLAEYRNIAIFGIDSRADNYNKGNRSDCIIIASINQKTKDIKLISVYRDTYLLLEENGKQVLDKVTHAYAYGGAQGAMKALNTNLDLNITECITVNFDAVIAAVDAIGGITIDLDAEEVKYANKYITDLAEETNNRTESDLIKSSGKQTLTGAQALAYSRIRYTSGGEHKRTERMRVVIEAMLSKAKTLSVGKLNNLIDTIFPKVKTTNLTSGEIISLVPSLASYNITESVGWPYNSKGTPTGIYYGVPVTLESNVLQLHQEVFGQEDYVVNDTIKGISNQIIKKTGYK